MIMSTEWIPGIQRVCSTIWDNFLFLHWPRPETLLTPMSGLDCLGLVLPSLRAILRGRGLDFPKPFLIGRCLFEFNICERSLHCQGGISPAVECAWKNIWLSKTTNIQKCLHKLLNFHTDVVILCCDWDSDPPRVEKETKTFFTLNPITLSPWVHRRTYSSTSCLLLPTPNRDKCCTKKHLLKQTCRGYFSMYVNLAFL